LAIMTSHAAKFFSEKSCTKNVHPVNFYSFKPSGYASKFKGVLGRFS
jgi:hypothetical protein